MCPKSIKIVMNGVPVAPHGLILGENEATPSRKFFKHIPGPQGPQNLKKTINVQKTLSGSWPDVGLTSDSLDTKKVS